MKRLSNCLYNKIKLLHELSSILWFIEHHADEDAQQADDDACCKLLAHLEGDISKYVQELKEMICKDNID